MSELGFIPQTQEWSDSMEDAYIQLPHKYCNTPCANTVCRGVNVKRVCEILDILSFFPKAKIQNVVFLSLHNDYHPILKNTIKFIRAHPELSLFMNTPLIKIYSESTGHLKLFFSSLNSDRVDLSFWMKNNVIQGCQLHFVYGCCTVYEFIDSQTWDESFSAFLNKTKEINIHF